MPYRLLQKIPRSGANGSPMTPSKLPPPNYPPNSGPPPRQALPQRILGQLGDATPIQFARDGTAVDFDGGIADALPGGDAGRSTAFCQQAQHFAFACAQALSLRLWSRGDAIEADWCNGPKPWPKTSARPLRPLPGSTPPARPMPSCWPTFSWRLLHRD